MMMTKKTTITARNKDNKKVTKLNNTTNNCKLVK